MEEGKQKQRRETVPRTQSVRGAVSFRVFGRICPILAVFIPCPYPLSMPRLSRARSGRLRRTLDSGCFNTIREGGMPVFRHTPLLTFSQKHGTTLTSRKEKERHLKTIKIYACQNKKEPPSNSRKGGTRKRPAAEQRRAGAGAMRSREGARAQGRSRKARSTAPRPRRHLRSNTQPKGGPSKATLAPSRRKGQTAM